MRTHDTTRSNDVTMPIGEHRRQLGMALVMGLAIGLVGTHLAVVRPLGSDMRNEMSLVRTDMELLVGTRSDVRRANDLLAALRRQRADIAEARTAIIEIAESRQAIQREADRSGETLAAVAGLGRLQNAIVASSEETRTARTALGEIGELRDALIGEGRRTIRARVAIDGFTGLQEAVLDRDPTTAGAIAAVEEMGRLQRSVLDESADTSAAMTGLNELASVKDEVLATTADLDTLEGIAIRTREVVRVAETTIAVAEEVQQRLVETTGDLDGVHEAITALDGVKEAVREAARGVYESRQVAEHLLYLQRDLADRGQDVLVARENATQLLAMQNDLLVDAGTISAAARNLNDLLGMQQMLAARTDRLVSAIRTLELLSDFEDELFEHTRSLETMRKSLVEVVMLQTAVGRALEVLEPLREMTNLRRLTNEEVQAAAGAILQRRGTRIGSLPTETTRGGTAVRESGEFFDTPEIEATTDGGLVPEPRPLDAE